VQKAGSSSARLQESFADFVQVRFCLSHGVNRFDRCEAFATSHMLHPMQFPRRIGLILLWLAAPLVAFGAANKNDPYLLVLRGAGNIALVVLSTMIVIVLLRRGRWRSMTGKLLIILSCLPPVLMSAAHLKFELRKHEVLAASIAEARQLGPHFMVGYSSFPEVARLAEQGLIGGVYVTPPQYPGPDGRCATCRDRRAPGQASRRGPAAADRRRRPGGRYRRASLAAADKSAGAGDARP